MEKHNDDDKWFSVHTQYNVENEDELFDLINYIIASVQAEYETANTEDYALAQEMLAAIGVRCAKTS